MLAVEALKRMKSDKFSQLPIVVGREVLGLFSYRSFANAVVVLSQKASDHTLNPLELLVEDCLEKPEFARVTDEFSEWFETIDKYDAVLVGEPNRLQGIVTAMDILRYLYGVASPFVLLAEIELSLRGLIQSAVEPNELSKCIEKCNEEKGVRRVPSRLNEMTFGAYLRVITHERNWEQFQPFFGGSRMRTMAKLEQLRDLRNTIFHFKRELSVVEHETLADGREWMLLKARAAEARRLEAKQ